MKYVYHDSCRRLGPMTAKQYAKLREGIASQDKVSIMLGVDIRTVQRREAGFIPVTKEAERAIRSLAAEERARRLIETAESKPVRASLEQIAEMLAVKP
jgi:hypothetical protein